MLQAYEESQGLAQNPDSVGGLVWAAVATAAMGASAYHGYKRNERQNPIAWAIWWGIWGGVVPIITVPVAYAQGFADPA